MLAIKARLCRRLETPAEAKYFLNNNKQPNSLGNTTKIQYCSFANLNADSPSPTPMGRK